MPAKIRAAQDCSRPASGELTRCLGRSAREETLGCPARGTECVGSAGLPGLRAQPERAAVSASRQLARIRLGRCQEAPPSVTPGTGTPDSRPRVAAGGRLALAPASHRPVRKTFLFLR